MTILDSVLGTLVALCGYKCMTVNLNVNFKNYIKTKSEVVIDCFVDNVK